MLLDVIGSSPAWPNAGEAHAGYLLSGPSEARLLLDCGAGVLSRLRERELLPVAGIVITHLHLDHWGDLVPWCWFRRRHARLAGCPELWLPPDALGALRSFARTFGSEGMFEATFVVNEYEPETPFEVAGFSVEAVAVAHYGVPSFGLRASADAVVGYSGDPAPCSALRELAAGADVFICEATLSDAADDGDPRGHMSAEEAKELAGTTRLLLAHRPSELGALAGAETATAGLQIEL